MSVEVAFSIQKNALDNSVNEYTLDFPNLLGTLFTNIPVKLDKLRTMAFTPATFSHQGKGYRKNEYVTSVTCLVLDLDEGIKDKNRGALFEKLKSMSCAYIVHYTYSCYEAYRTKQEYKLRVIIPLRTPVPAAEWISFWQKARAFFGEWKWDPATKNLARLYFLVSAPSREARDWMLNQPWLKYDVTSPFLDPDVIRAVSTPQAVLAKKHTPITSTPLPVIETNLRERLRTLKTNPTKTGLAMALGAILDGLEYSKQGERNPTMHAVNMYIAGLYPHHDPDMLAQLYLRSHEVMAHLHVEPPDDLTKVARNIAGAQKLHLENLAQRVEAVTSRESRFMREVAGSNDAEYRYTDADKSEMAASLDITVDELEDRWLMVDPSCRELFMVGKSGIYSCVNNQLAWSTERLRLLPTGLPLTTWTKQGRERAISLNDFAEKHGRTLSYVAYDNRLQTHRLSKENGLHLPCPYSDVKPAFNERADAFFRTLFGKQYDTAQNWLAFFRDTSEIIPALLLIGPKDVGKNLLAAGLGSMWRHKIPVPFENAITKFTNFDLTYMPVIHVDETFPRTIDVSKYIRIFITSREFMVEKKYGAVYKLLGHLRIIVSANNLEKTLQFHKDDELEKNDLDALSDRMWVVDAQPQTKTLLESWTPQQKNDLAQHGIAEHVLYLEQKYKIRKSNTRFAVRPSAEHDGVTTKHFTLNDRHVRVIMSLIKNAMDADVKGQKQPGICWGEGWLRVLPSDFMKTQDWSSITRASRWTNPGTHLSKVGVRSTFRYLGSTARCYVIENDLFLTFVEHYHGEDAEKYKGMIEGECNH